MIENQYKGKSAQQVWDEWAPEQRYHFLIDHGVDEIPATIYVKQKYKLLPNHIKEKADSHIESGQYATGGKLSSFWDATKKHASTAYNKTKHVSKKAYDKTKKAVKDKIHDTKKRIALEVIDATKDKVTDNKYKMTLKGAENLVEDKYAKGGTIESAWKKFINWCNEEI